MTPIRFVLCAAICGAALVVAGVAGLAGPWWALIIAGLEMLGGAAALMHDDGRSP